VENCCNYVTVIVCSCNGDTDNPTNEQNFVFIVMVSGWNCNVRIKNSDDVVIEVQYEMGVIG
jgi:hypothetical protein